MNLRFGPFTLLALVLAGYFVWFWGSGKPRPSARLEPPAQNLGVIVKESTRVLHYSVRNTGNVPLRIDSETHDCGCVNVEYPHGSFAPGHTAELTIRFRAPAWVGDFHESSRVTVAPGGQELKAEISGKSSTALTLESAGWVAIGGSQGKVKQTVVEDHRLPPGASLVAKVRGPDAGCLAVKLTRRDSEHTAAEVTLRSAPTHGTRNFYVDFSDPADSTALVTWTLHPL